MRPIFYAVTLLLGFGFALSAPGLKEQDDESSVVRMPVLHEGVVPAAAANISLMSYLLWTPSNPGDEEFYELELYDKDNLARSGFDPALPTYVIHPGWAASGLSSWITEGKTNILAWKDANVISVDWGEVVNHVNYDADVDTMYEVAVLNAEMIDWIVTSTGILTSTIEMTGSSLGAHCIGMTARNMVTGKVARLTGLDPAGPEFYHKNETQRLDKSQADYVDIIHSNGCAVNDICLGIGQSLGHIDIRPNGGEHQPGCLVDATGCSHDRAHMLWVESIAIAVDPLNNLAFTAWPCESWELFQNGTCPECEAGCTNMGIETDKSLTGEYFLSTRARSPYAMGDDQGSD